MRQPCRLVLLLLLLIPAGGRAFRCPSRWPVARRGALAAPAVCGLSAALAPPAGSHLVVDSLAAAAAFVDADDANICRIVRAVPDALTRDGRYAAGDAGSAWSALPGEASAVADFRAPADAEDALGPILALAAPEGRAEVLREVVQLGTFFQTLLQCEAIETRLEVMDAKVGRRGMLMLVVVTISLRTSPRGPCAPA
jgi:hypothetical protein